MAGVRPGGWKGYGSAGWSLALPPFARAGRGERRTPVLLLHHTPFGLAKG